MSLLSQGNDLTRPLAPAEPSLAAVGDYLALMKPRVMSLVVFTALVGLAVAPGHLHPVIAFTALLCIAVGAGAAGAFPPIIGWAAASGGTGLESILLFLIIFFWTPPHFWALALCRTGEYARAGIPMLPVVAGRSETQRQILIYTLVLAPLGAAPWLLGFAGSAYGAVAVATGGIMILLALRLRGQQGAAQEQTARNLFAFSVLYLFLLFAVLLVNHAPPPPPGGLG